MLDSKTQQRWNKVEADNELGVLEFSELVFESDSESSKGIMDASHIFQMAQLNNDFEEMEKQTKIFRQFVNDRLDEIEGLLESKLS